MEGLIKLQEIIRRGNASEIAEFRLNRIIPDEISDDLYGTLALASSPNFENNILSPDELLIEAVEDTISRSEDVFQLVGLALKNGATPNLYVTVNYFDDDGDSQMTILHILIYAWRIHLERGGDNPSALLMIVAILSAAGANVKLPVTDPELLLKRRRAINKMESAAGVMEEVGEPRSVLGYIASDDSDLSDEILKYVAIFTAFRGTLADIKNIVKDNYFVAGDIELRVPVSEFDSSQMESLAVTIGEVLDDPSHMSGLEGDEKLFRCVGWHANRCVQQLLQSDNISDTGLEAAFLNAVESGNGVGVSQIVASGFVPRYNHVDRVIFYGKLKEFQGLTLSAEIQTGILVKMVELGSSLDYEQLSTVGSYSDSTFQVISEMQMTPYWKRVCDAPGSYVRADLRNLARELDLDPEMDKQALCEEFSALSDATVESVLEQSKKLQHAKRRFHETSTADVVAKKATIAREYENAHLLSRDIDDYSKFDLHCLKDPSNGKSYCFEGVDYPKILRSGINPYTDNSISIADLAEIKAKRDTLVMLGLPLESTGIETAMKKLHQGRAGEDYELWVRVRRDNFLAMVDSRRVNLDSALFTNDEYGGGLTISDMEEVLNDIGNRDDIRLSPTNNREHAIRSFALTFMEWLDDAYAVPSAKSSENAIMSLIDNLVESISKIPIASNEE